MGTIKDRNDRDLVDTEEIKKRWKEYTEKLYKKKNHNDPDNHNGVVTPLEPDTLECEVKWALGSTAANKASEGDGIPAELFIVKLKKILKDDAIKDAAVLNLSANLENPALATGLEKVNLHPNSQEGQ